MRTVIRIILTAAATVIAVGPAAAQAPEGFRPAVLITITPTPASSGAGARSPLAVTERLVSFDANKDHRLTRDELPERMQGLIARADRNADGVLDLEEIRAFVNGASSERRLSDRPVLFEGLTGVISDLKLPPAKHQKALAIVSTHKAALNFNEPSGSDLYKAMRLLLDDEEFENFAAAAGRLARTAQIRMGRTSGGVVGGLPPPPPGR